MDRQTVVVKVGGSTLPHREAVLADLAELHGAGVEVVIAHGGGAVLTDWLERVNKQPTFVNGLRVTDEETLEMAVMVFAGAVNKQLVALLNDARIPAVGISGVDGGLVRARRQTEPDIGLVGEAEEVDIAPLRALLDRGLIPVVACIVLGPAGQIYNINADTLAGDLARALPASRVAFLTDVPGVHRADGKVIPTLSKDETDQLIAEGVITGGMIPKVEACLRCLDGVPEAVILDGSVPHVLRDHILGSATAGTVFRSRTWAQ
ncbi:MAG: acetylglutamate kinase [Dehalococcoidia bacterium]|nr:acetylglutamate kinase [Dehalococcoidia bacterium]